MTALVTPMSNNGEIDYIQWQKLIQHQIKAGIKAIIVAGTTGESALLNNSE
ncbi:MAG: dihydrodipicolinate synthase family protein, partial [Alcanivoracaceae bacterium]|nr:dihydrodipicolinate synthase family protein [Alcanivoracaceae bacterium]